MLKMVNLMFSIRCRNIQETERLVLGGGTVSAPQQGSGAQPEPAAWPKSPPALCTKPPGFLVCEEAF